ncbi:MAG TPA: hypothetical protein VFU68_01885 [Terracidiphilus sp.]|nr:hypothetical protein [Terracidiphilus sp.]
MANGNDRNNWHNNWRDNWMDRLEMIFRSIHFPTKGKGNHSHWFKAPIAASRFSARGKALESETGAARMNSKVAGGQPLLRCNGVALCPKMRVKIGILAGQAGSEADQTPYLMLPHALEGDYLFTQLGTERSPFKFRSESEVVLLNFLRMRAGDLLPLGGLVNVENLRRQAAPRPNARGIA